MKEIIEDTIYDSAEENISYIKELFKDNSDVIYRDFYAGDIKAGIVYIDNMTNKVLLNDYVLESLMLNEHKIRDVKNIKDHLLTVSDVLEVSSMEKVVLFILSGDTAFFLDGLDKCYILSTRLWATRGVGEVANETSVRGAREGFSEVIRFNTVLVRRRVRDSRLKIVAKSLGTRSKTDTAILYIEDIVNNDVLEKLKSRLNDINIDAILDSGYVEQLIEDDKWSLFPQVQVTERPDVVAAALYEGRIALIVDNSPQALIVPATLPNFFQSPDDYYQRWVYSSAVRILRLISIIISLIMPALYVAVTSFHTSIMPTKLAYSIAASREGVPFPAFIEAIIMELSLALLMESVTRLPRPIGATIGIVGGLVIGQAAVSAGIVSPIMIIIVSITAISSFITTNYEITFAFRIMRFILIILSAIIGLYGIALGFIIMTIHLIKLKSFGISYLSPVVNIDRGDMKDNFIKYPIEYFIKRPQYMNAKDRIRQKSKK